jgi:hypothetical protein
MVKEFSQPFMLLRALHVVTSGDYPFPSILIRTTCIAKHIQYIAVRISRTRRGGKEPWQWPPKFNGHERRPKHCVSNCGLLGYDW